MKRRWLRWLAYLAGGILLLVAAIYLIGMTRPELVVANCEIEIQKPLPVVFELFANPLRMKDWYPEVDSVEIVSQQPLRYRMTAGGITGEMETTVLAPNEHIVTKSLPNAMGMSCEWDTRLSPTATGTKIVHTAHMKFSSPFLRFLMSLMDANKEELKTLESMKRYAESH